MDAESRALVTAGELAGWSEARGFISSRMDGSATRATDSSSTSRQVAGCADLLVEPLVTPVRTFCKETTMSDSIYLYIFFNSKQSHLPSFSMEVINISIIDVTNYRNILTNKHINKCSTLFFFMK